MVQIRLLLRWVALALVGWAGSFAQLSAQKYEFPHYGPYVPSYLTDGYETQASLTGEWLDVESNQTYQAPFWVANKNELTIKKDVFLPKKPSDTLLLYFEGLAWSAEVYFNGRLVGFNTDPFQPFTLPLSPRWFFPQWNEIKIKLTLDGASRPFYPKKMIGLHKPAYLLRKQTLPYYIEQVEYPTVVQQDTALYYAPYHPDYGYNLPPELFLKDIQQLQENGIFALYFPFRPANYLLRIAARKGMAVQLKPPLYYAHHHRYPCPAPLYAPWTDEQRKPTPAYQTYHPVIEPAGDFDRNRLLLLIALPVLLLVFWKLTDPRSFRDLLNPARASNKLYEPVKDYFPQKKGVLLFIKIYQTLNTALALAFVLKYLEMKGQIDVLNQFTYPSLLYRIYQNADNNLIYIFLNILSVFAIFNAIRYIIIRFSEWAYGNRELTTAWNAIDVIAQNPNHLIILALGFLLMLNTEHGWLFYLFVTFYVFHLLRKYFILIVGINNILKIPLMINILYICAVEILLWALLL